MQKHPGFLENADRIEKNRSDGQVLYGFDDDDGTTTWYTKDGILDSVTPTPSDDDYRETESLDD